MAKIQVIENQDGEVAIVKTVFGFIRLYRLISFKEWSLFSSWYPEHLSNSVHLEFDRLCDNPKEEQHPKSEAVIRELEF